MKGEKPEKRTATWGLVHDEIPCVGKGKIKVKGIHYPVRVYEIDPKGRGEEPA